MHRGLTSRAAIIAASLLWWTAASAQEGSTTRELKELPPRAANRMVQKNLLSILEPVHQIRSGMLRQIRGVSLMTKPYGTEFDGVCRRDAVTLRYASTDKGAVPEDAPLQPYGLEAVPLFRIIKLPAREAVALGHQGDVWRAECSAASRDEEANWFGAPDALTAVQGALVLEAAVKAVRFDALKAQSCSGVDDPKRTTCEAAILENGDLSKLDAIATCPAEAGTLCYVIDLGNSTRLTIKAKAQDEALMPGTITSIAIEQFIIVT